MERLEPWLQQAESAAKRKKKKKMMMMNETNRYISLKRNGFAFLLNMLADIGWRRDEGISHSFYSFASPFRNNGTPAWGRKNRDLCSGGIRRHKQKQELLNPVSDRQGKYLLLAPFQSVAVYTFAFFSHR